MVDAVPEVDNRGRNARRSLIKVTLDLEFEVVMEAAQDRRAFSHP